MGKLTKEAVEGGRFIRERSCTDCCMIPLGLLFVAGWVAVAIVAYLNGDPKILLLPTDTYGNTCGLGELTSLPNIFYPKPTNLQVGVCLASCPEIGSIVCDAQKQPKSKLPGSTDVTGNFPNYIYNMSGADYLAASAALPACLAGISLVCTPDLFARAELAFGVQERIKTGNCFLAAYPTTILLHRCAPLLDQFQSTTTTNSKGITLASLRQQLTDLSYGQFFVRGFGETQAAWIIIVICIGAACVLSLLWVLVMRWIMAPIVYLSLCLIIAAFVGLGLLSRHQYLALQLLEVNGDTGTKNQRILWQTVQYLSFVAAGMFLLICLWLLKRIRISIELLKEGGRAFLATPTLVFIPILVSVGLFGLMCFFVSLTLYIQSMGNFTSEKIKVLTDNQLFAQLETQVSLDIKSFNPNVSNRWLHLYNFFGFLWFSNYFIMEGFFIITMAACVWYFSATTEEEAIAQKRLKKTPAGTVIQAFYTTIRYHMGTILFGALLIALIQFIRAIVLYIERQLQRQFGNNQTYRVIVCCINCILWCLEKTIKLISSTAFVVVCVKNCNFFTGCATALKILTENVLRVGTLTTISFVITTLLKILIATSTTILGWGLIQVKKLHYGNNEIDSGLFPLIFVFIASYIVATLFISVYESCVDAIMICFFIDEMELEGKFMPRTLSKLIGLYAAVEKAKQEFDEKTQKIAKEEDTNPK